MASKWEPVENGTYYGTDAQQWDYQVEGKVIRAKFQKYMTSTFRMPFDWRICRPVPDAGVMPSVIRTNLVKVLEWQQEHIEANPLYGILDGVDARERDLQKIAEMLKWLAQIGASDDE